MEFNFFRKKEVAPQADVSVEPKSEKGGIEQETSKMFEEGKRQVGNEALELKKVEVKEGNPQGKKNKVAIIAVLSLLTIFSAMSTTGCTRMQNKIIIDQIENDIFGDTAENIIKRNKAKSYDLLRVEQDEAKKIKNNENMDVHQKKEAIHKAYQRRGKIN